MITLLEEGEDQDNDDDEDYSFEGLEWLLFEQTQESVEKESLKAKGC